MRGKLSMRPMTAAASARTRTVMPSALPMGTLITPARRKTVAKARTVVITHTVVWMRPTGTPSVEARSERSATPRIAMPTRVARRNQRQTAEQQRDDDQDHQVVVVEGDATDLGRDVEGRIEVGAAEALEAEPTAA